MKKVFILAFLPVLMISIQSCSKEKRLEKALYKKDGNWNVKSAEWSQVTQSSSSGQSVVTGSSTDAGTFEFDESGSGSYSITLGTETYAQSFNWTVSEEEFSIVKVSQSYDFSTGEIIQKAVAFSGKQTDKNILEVEGSETLQYFSGDIEQNVMAGTFILERK